METLLEKMLTLISNSTTKFKTFRIWFYAKGQNMSKSDLNQVKEACDSKIKGCGVTPPKIIDSTKL